MEDEEQGVNLVELAASFDGSPEELADAICAHAEPLLVRHRDWDSRLQMEVLDRFATALDRFQLLLYLHAHLHRAFVERYAEEREGRRSGVPEAVVSLAERGALAAEEILALCRAGLAGGALTRWRTLYELSVVAAFVLEAGDETARALIDHETLARLRLRGSYQHWARQAGTDQVSGEEMAELDEAERAILARHGPALGDPYGWAHHALMKRSRRYRERFERRVQRSPALLDLAVAARASGDHVFFRRASAVIHGGDPSMGDELATAPLAPSLEGIDTVLPLAGDSFVLLIAALAWSYPKPPDPDLVRLGGDVALALAGSLREACSGGE